MGGRRYLMIQYLSKEQLSEEDIHSTEEQLLHNKFLNCQVVNYFSFSPDMKVWGFIFYVKNKVNDNRSNYSVINDEGKFMHANFCKFIKIFEVEEIQKLQDEYIYMNYQTYEGLKLKLMKRKITKDQESQTSEEFVPLLKRKNNHKCVPFCTFEPTLQLICKHKL